MASQRKQSGARHPRSPLPRQQTVREKLKNVQRQPVPPIPSPRTPTAGGNSNGGVAQAPRSHCMVAAVREVQRVQ